MHELSLFAGAGGGVLGTTLLGFRPIGYVEWDDYCQRVLAQRIKDGILREAPIFSDVRAFICEGYAASYTGLVDVLTAGFPCQPFSVAGKQLGASDERNMWPATADVIQIVQPRFVLLENVPGVRFYLPVVIRDLCRLGYDVQRPLILGADDVGAPHRRKRVWIMAYSSGIGQCEQKTGEPACDENRNNPPCECNGETEFYAAVPGCETVADPGKPQWDGRRDRFSGWEREPLETLRDARERGREEDGLPVPESLLGRVADGVANRVDRLKAIGNGQVPQVVATAWELLTQG